MRCEVCDCRQLAVGRILAGAGVIVIGKYQNFIRFKIPRHNKNTRDKVCNASTRLTSPTFVSLDQLNQRSSFLDHHPHSKGYPVLLSRTQDTPEEVYTALSHGFWNGRILALASTKVDLMSKVNDHPLSASAQSKLCLLAP